MPDEVRFHFIKSTDCKEVSVDGVFGGLTTTGRIFIAPFNERAPIPQETVHQILSEGVLGPELTEQRVQKEDVVRIVHAVLHMEVPVAKLLIEFLQQRIADLEKAKAIIEGVSR